MKLVTVTEMRAIEQEADAAGLAYAQMMENAGRGLADEIELLVYSQEDEKEVLALVGPGNNGGDALVALAHLAADGWRARAYLVNRKPGGDALLERLKQAGGDIILSANDPEFEKLDTFVSSADVVVDGLLGTGVKLPLREELALLLDTVNEIIAEQTWPPYVVAVDCPSGVDCDTGRAAEEVIPASLTVCMASVKRGLLQFPAFELAGEIRVVDIGLSDDIPSWAAIRHFAVDDEMVEEILPARPGDAHKGTFGTVLVAAGSVSYTGAALLAGKAAYRSGAGLVKMAVPGVLHPALAGNFPEATWALLPHEMGFIAAGAAEALPQHFERASALLLGPGLGTEETTFKFVENLFSGNPSGKKQASAIGFVHGESNMADGKNTVFPPVIVDADGLRLLARLENWHKLLPAGSVLTPHPGEMSVLTGLETEKIQQARLDVALKYAAGWGHVVVLKGAFTVIAAPDGRASVIPVATPALARAGTGDVLAGLIAGLRAQGVEAYEAALAGAWIHAQAGLLAAEKVGAEAAVLAGDVLAAVGEVLGGF